MRTSYGTFETFWLISLAPIAAGTLVTWAAQALHLEFKTYDHLILLVFGLCFASAIAVLSPRLQKYIVKGNRHVLILSAAISLAGGVVTLLYNFPSEDDFYYLPNAVYFLDHPTSTMGLDIKFISTIGSPLTSFTWSTSGPYEYMETVLARLLGMNVLDVYYCVIPPVAGVFTVLSLIYTTRVFVAESNAAIVGAGAGALITLCLCESVLSIGNWYFVRSFQAKIVYLTMVLPLIFRFTIDYFLSLDRKYLLLLLVASIAGLGMTASSAVVTLIYGGVMSVAFLIIPRWLGLNDKAVPTVARYWTSLSPLLVYLLIYKVAFSAGLGEGSWALAGWPTTVFEHVKLFLFWRSNGVSYSLAVFLLFSIAAIVLTRGAQRAVLVLWLCAALLTVFNPFIADFLIKKLNLEILYTRVFFILPFPLVVSISIGALASRAEHSNRRILAIASILLFLFVGILVPYLRGMLMFPPRYKMGSEHMADIMEVVRVARALQGVTLAPPYVAGTLGEYFSKIENVSLGGNETVWLNNIHMEDDAKERLAASDFVESGDHGEAAPFVAVVKRYRPANLIVTKKSFSKNESVFEQIGTTYILFASTSTYLVYNRRVR